MQDLHIPLRGRLEASWWMSQASQELQDLLANRVLWVVSTDSEDADGLLYILCESHFECFSDDIRKAYKLIVQELPNLEVEIVSALERYRYPCGNSERKYQ